MSELKEKYIQFCCDFYNEHTPEDKIWFGRMFDDCHQEHNKRNSSMYRWQFPLMILKSQQAEIDQHQLEIHALGEANLNQAMMLAKKQEEIDSLKAQLSLQRDRNKALETELTSSRNYGDGLQKRINELERGLNEVGYDSGCECCMLNQVDVREALRGEHE